MFSFGITLYRVLHVNWAFGKFPWDTLQYFSANTTKWKLNHKWRQFVRSRLNLTLSINPLCQCSQIFFLFFMIFSKIPNLADFRIMWYKCRLLVTLVSEQILEYYYEWSKIAHQICIIQSIIKTFSNFTLVLYEKIFQAFIWSNLKYFIIDHANYAKAVSLQNNSFCWIIYLDNSLKTYTYIILHTHVGWIQRNNVQKFTFWIYRLYLWNTLYIPKISIYM